MQSVSDDEYQKFCVKMISHAIQRPSMWYQDLKDFENIMFGHWTAFSQVYGLDREKSFGWLFSKWLYEKKRMSCSDGWSSGVKRIAMEKQISSDVVFGELVSKFITEWSLQV